MLRKKKTTQPSEEAEAELNDAMKELVRQTEALLGSPELSSDKPQKNTTEEVSKKATEEVKPDKIAKDDLPKKPILPKKRHIPHRKGRSFEIISQPKQPKKIKATLKTAAASPVPLLEASKPPQLLEAEASEVAFESSVAESSPSESQARIRQKEKGSLRVNGVEGFSDTPALKPAIESNVSVSRTGIVFSENSEKDTKSDMGDKKEVGPVDDELDKQVELPPAKNDKTVKAVDAKDQSAKLTDDKPSKNDEPPARGSGELYANNLVKTKKPRGYKPPASQQKPTVFDTTEYHAELNDWSKLDKSSGGKWVILILLLLLLAAFIYLFVLKMPLPLVNLI